MTPKHFLKVMHASLLIEIMMHELLSRSALVSCVFSFAFKLSSEKRISGILEHMVNHIPAVPLAECSSCESLYVPNSSEKDLM
jgi:anthranilate phosphoribosyltransferase